MLPSTLVTSLSLPIIPIVIQRRHRAPGPGTVRSPKVPALWDLLTVMAALHPLSPTLLTFSAAILVH